VGEVAPFYGSTQEPFEILLWKRHSWSPSLWWKYQSFQANTEADLRCILLRCFLSAERLAWIIELSGWSALPLTISKIFKKQTIERIGLLKPTMHKTSSKKKCQRFKFWIIQQHSTHSYKAGNVLHWYSALGQPCITLWGMYSAVHARRVACARLSLPPAGVSLDCHQV